MTPDRDHEPRAACFLALDALRAQFGPDLPLAGGLRDGFVCGGKRIPFLAPPRGIFKAAEQNGSAALSVLTSVNSPYDDEETDEGFWYAYRRGADDLADNRALRAAWADGVPLAYFVGIRPGWYQALYPVWAIERDDVMRRVLLSPSPGGAADLRPPDAGERRYATREARVRLHQSRFRGVVLPAYRERCAVCRLREPRLLDAAHIVGDREERGEPVVPNGLSLCSIHHRAFDEDLIGIDPDRRVHVSRRLLDDEDGPMLELLKTFHGGRISAPTHPRTAPDRERLAARFERFRAG